MREKSLRKRKRESERKKEKRVERTDESRSQTEREEKILGQKERERKDSEKESLISHFPYTHAHMSVCRNYKEKEQQDRVQSQRPRGGFPSAQAICICPVFPCLTISICTSVCSSKLRRQITTRQNPITGTKKRVPLRPSNFLPSSVTMSRIFHNPVHNLQRFHTLATSAWVPQLPCSVQQTTCHASLNRQITIQMRFPSSCPWCVLCPRSRSVVHRQ